LFLYLPRRNESEIIKPFSSATEALRQKEPLLQIINFANDLQKLIQQLQLLDSLYNITNTIAPGTSNSDDTSSSDIDTEFSAVDVSSVHQLIILQNYRTPNNLTKGKSKLIII
jgi:hypothetical protein